MAEIGVNQDFLFLPLEYDCFVYSLLNQKLKILN